MSYGVKLLFMITQVISKWEWMTETRRYFIIEFTKFTCADQWTIYRIPNERKQYDLFGTQDLFIMF